MKKTRIASFLLALCSLGCLGAGAANSLTASAATADNYNTTLTMQSGYKSGFFAPVSSLFDYLGATIEFDLYDSDFKELNYNKSYDVMSFSGTSGGLASVNFVFGKVEDYPYAKAPQTPSWHIYQTTEYNFGGFQYFCNGQIKEWSNRGNSALITEYIGSPEDFMEDGYSYKVSLTYDTFMYQGKEYGGDSEWFCVEKKGIFEDESAYEVLFAYQKKVHAASFGQRYTNGTMAGMEVQGLCMKANLGGAATSADGVGHSAHLEIDNVRIYDGVDYEEAAVKYTEDFETVAEDSIIMPTLMQAGATLCRFEGENYLELPGGVRYIAANYSDAIGKTEATTCQLSLAKKELFNVTFKDSETKEIIATSKTCSGLDISGTKIYSGSKVYKFDYSKIDFSSITEDFEVYGTPVSYFTLTLISGVNNVNDKVLRVSVEENFKLTEDVLIRQDYDLLGFTTVEGGTEVQYDVGSMLNMKCQDKTLYAIWRMKSFATNYFSGKINVNSLTTRPGEVPYYQGSTPQKAGYVFAGWSDTIAASQNHTLTARFVKVDDRNAENKALSVDGNVKITREGYGSASSVDVVFDLISLPANASISILNTDITEFMEEGCRIKVTLTSSGNISVSKGYLNSEKYTYVGSKTTNSTISSIPMEFSGSIVLDTLTMSYDGENLYEENFEGIESVSEGIYNNYYVIEGAASIVSCPKNHAVTFLDETTNRELSKVYVYDGGSVMLIDSIEGVTSAISWDKTQSDLSNIQSDVIVKASLTWLNCAISFDVSGGVFGFIALDKTLAPISGIYGETVTLPTIEYGNFAIVGWTDVQDGGYVKYANDFVLTETSLTLYPVWGGKMLTAEFYAEDGTTLLETQEVEYNATVLFGGEAPQKEGYTFIGWDKSTSGITEDTKFVAQYEKALAGVQVSVLGGTGGGKYTEGDTVTIAFRKINGITFTGWRVVSGDVTVTETNGVYTFVVGTQDVVIEAVATQDGTLLSDGCISTVSLGSISAIALCGIALMFQKRRKEN